MEKVVQAKSPHVAALGSEAGGTFVRFCGTERIEANQDKTSPDLWCWRKPLTCLTRFRENDVIMATAQQAGALVEGC